jgi:hypothetical protein
VEVTGFLQAVVALPLAKEQIEKWAWFFRTFWRRKKISFPRWASNPVSAIQHLYPYTD